MSEIKKLKHFMLPQHTNDLHAKEAMSSISLTRDVADKINELVDSYNALNKWQLEKHQEQDGKIAKAVIYMKDNLINSIYDLLKLYIDSDKVNEILLEVIDGDISIMKNKLNYYTPEMYGAKGDGIQDDTEAFLAMIADVEENIRMRSFVGEEPCKDYSFVDFKFSGNYRISKPLVFDTTYGLTLNNLKLTATPYFEGEGMIVLSTITRNFKGTNLTINGNLTADACIVVKDYTLTIDFANAELTHFKKFGLYADGKGHEFKVVNMRINQYEWGEWESVATPYTDGVGLYLGAERHDNHFSQLIVNYCTKYGIQLEGGATKICNSHFYSCEVLNVGKYNTFDNCYFDNAPFKTYGFFNLTNSLLLKSEGDAEPFVYFLVESDANNWQYDTCIMNNNTFKAVDYVENVIDLGTLTELPKFTTIGNTFYYAKPFTSHSRLGHTMNPWDEERESFEMLQAGMIPTGYKIYGNLALIWGQQAGNGFVTYPNGIELAETLYIGFERQDNTNPNLIPWANTIKPNSFWANSVGEGSVVKWFVVGIVK